MAHADYDCCACCDRKVNYAPNAAPKEVLCPDCAVDLSQLTCKRITTPGELLDWVRMAIDHGLGRTAAQILMDSKYHRCHYGNGLDRLIMDHLPLDEVQPKNREAL